MKWFAASHRASLSIPLMEDIIGEPERIKRYLMEADIALSIYVFVN
jgi:hypothetical protein